MTRVPQASVPRERSTARPVSRPHDAHEHEADRAADVVTRGGSVAGWWFSAVPTLAPVQREETGAPKTDEEKLAEGAGKAAEAALETPQGKALKERVLADPLVKPVADALTSTPGLIGVGAGLVGGVTAFGLAGKPLPAQIPAIPLDKITPGLSGKVTIEGPVDAPTFVGLSLTYKEQGPKSKAAPNAVAADIARLKAQEQMFKPKAQKDAEKREEQDLIAAWIASQRLPTLQIPLVPAADAAKRKPDEATTPVQPAPATASAAPPARAHVDDAIAGSGRPLEPPARRAMEARFGRDFSTVRIHDDARAVRAADAIDAAAFTVGDDIAFAPGRYDPASAAGERLLAHELAHVAQQTQPDGRREAQPLPDATRGDLERRFGRPLAHVRVHDGEEGEAVARRHAAIAVAHQSDVYFAAGAYAPGTPQGDRILRHEVAHVLQSETTGGRPWSTEALEAEAELAALRPGPVEVSGRAHRRRPLFMKTFVSTVAAGHQGYLDAAVAFYKLWENETAIKIGSYQEIVSSLATAKAPLPEFRIVAHGDATSLFLPLLKAGEDFASQAGLGLQTQESLATELGGRAHLAADMTATIHGWLAADATAKPLLAKLGLAAAPGGMLQEFLWWVADEYLAVNGQESGTGTPTTDAERTALRDRVTRAQTAVKGLAAKALPAGATATDLAELRTRSLAAFAAAGWQWPLAPGDLKAKLAAFDTPDAAATLREVKAGTFEDKLKLVKARVSDKTHIEIRGCNVGNNDDFLNGIREFFGTQPGLPSISAPMLFQFFGRPGITVVPGGSNPPLADSLKFLFEETFDDTSTSADVQAAVTTARLTTVGDLAEVLRFANIQAEFERWWQMKSTAAGAAQPVAAATLADFQAFLTSGKAFPANAPGMATESLFFLVLVSPSAVAALLDWVRDQGYTLPGGKDFAKHFAGGSTQSTAARLVGAQGAIWVDWLGDDFPVPKRIVFPEDPEYKANIKRLP
jgi:hypothetical protein